MEYMSCFDSLWADEVVNDLYKAGVTDDKLSFLHKLNKTHHIKVKTWLASQMGYCGKCCMPRRPMGKHRVWGHGGRIWEGQP